MFPTGTEGLSDYHIHNCTEFLGSTHILNVSVMYPMPVVTLCGIFSSGGKALGRVMHGEWNAHGY